MSATFGLSSARTQKRMENSGAAALDFIRNGQLTMKGLFEGRQAIFMFGFHNRRGLNSKSVYLASTGSAEQDSLFYEALRSAYNARFGAIEERPAQHDRVKGRLTYHNTWKPDQYTTIDLSYDPEITERFTGDTTANRPIKLMYKFTKWNK